ncbi:YbhN family protein [Prosthecobacter sp.]|uniref:YbhN family protein n=1 Tax=Prosthecobacter sp. TaxID=1965333 RepID=UPI003783229F
MSEQPSPDDPQDSLLDSEVKPSSTPWLVWLLGAAACAALILVVTHLTEEEEFLQLLRQIDIVWLGLALVLQSLTYLLQGIVWRVVAAVRGQRLSLGKSFELSLAMLFVDQALPTGGISGVAVVSGALSRMGMPRAVVASAVLVDVAMYHLAYASCMALALGVTLYHAYLPLWVDIAMLVFVLVEFGVSAFLIFLPSGGTVWVKAKLRRFAKLTRLLQWVEHAPSGSFHNRRVLLLAFSMHALIFVLDAATIWVAARALGFAASSSGVFSSFMASNLFRTIGIIPGGLGTFETASVMSLRSIGMPLSVGLSATLLFRGLSFWLPMIPGLVCSRRLLDQGSKRLSY